MINALVIGCGNIGALYDFNNDKTHTHSKALSKLSNINVSVFDIDLETSAKVAEKYNFKCLKRINDVKWTDFQWVIVSTPTKTHAYWLKLLIEEKIPIIICEKPISQNLNEIEILENLYKQNKSKVVVNYIRRFQPAFEKLKQKIEKFGNQPNTIIVKYQRGLINNFSHALDLINYVFDVSTLNNLHISDQTFDEIEEDPTTSFTATFDQTSIHAVGLSNARFSYFEIEVFYNSHKIAIKDSGNTLSVYEANTYETYYLPLSNIPIFNEEHVLDHYMTNVYKYVIDVFEEKKEDNFLVTTNLNKQLLKLI